MKAHSRISRESTYGVGNVQVRVAVSDGITESAGLLFVAGSAVCRINFQSNQLAQLKHRIFATLHQVGALDGRSRVELACSNGVEQIPLIDCFSGSVAMRGSLIPCRHGMDPEYRVCTPYGVWTEYRGRCKVGNIVLKSRNGNRGLKVWQPRGLLGFIYIEEVEAVRRIPCWSMVEYSMYISYLPTEYLPTYIQRIWGTSSRNPYL